MTHARVSFSRDIPKALATNVERARKVDAIIVFRIDGKQGGVWTLNLKDEVGVQEGEAENADCIIELKDRDWEQLTQQPGAAMQLFLDGKLQIKGNAVIATQLQSVLG